jgi:hypothetical protein
LLDELARAMLVAATQERDRLLASVEHEAEAQVRKVRGRAIAEASELKRQAEEDADEIHARTVAEIERIRRRAERRIGVRRGRLERHLIGHAEVIEHEIDRVDHAVEAYGRELDGYFVGLRAQRDPGEIVRLAEALPATPDFDALRAEARAEAIARLSGSERTRTAGRVVDPDGGGDGGTPVVPGPVEGAMSEGATSEAATSEAAASLVGVMDPAAASARHGTTTLTRVMRTLSGLTSSTGRSG